MSLDALAPRVAQHNERAFEELYNKTRQAVYSVCLGIVKSHYVAEELSQDTYVAVWTYSEKFRGRGYKTWILTIAKNKALNYLKKAQNELSVDISENDELGSYENDMELGITLKTALSVLSEDERQIVLLRNSGVKAKEIASFMGMPRGTVSWKYKEAIEKMKKYMEGSK